MSFEFSCMTLVTKRFLFRMKWFYGQISLGCNFDNSMNIISDIWTKGYMLTLGQLVLHSLFSLVDATGSLFFFFSLKKQLLTKSSTSSKPHALTLEMLAPYPQNLFYFFHCFSSLAYIGGCPHCIRCHCTLFSLWNSCHFQQVNTSNFIPNVNSKFIIFFFFFLIRIIFFFLLSEINICINWE